MGVNSLPKTVTRQRRGCYLNPGPSAPESSTLTTRLPSHPHPNCQILISQSLNSEKTMNLHWRHRSAIGTNTLAESVAESVGRTEQERVEAPIVGPSIPFVVIEIVWTITVRVVDVSFLAVNKIRNLSKIVTKNWRKSYDRLTTNWRKSYEKLRRKVSKITYENLGTILGTLKFWAYDKVTMNLGRS